MYGYVQRTCYCGKLKHAIFAINDCYETNAQMATLLHCMDYYGYRTFGNNYDKGLDWIDPAIYCMWIINYLRFPFALLYSITIK